MLAAFTLWQQVAFLPHKRKKIKLQKKLPIVVSIVFITRLFDAGASIGLYKSTWAVSQLG